MFLNKMSLVLLVTILGTSWVRASPVDSGCGGRCNNTNPASSVQAAFIEQQENHFDHIPNGGTSVGAKIDQKFNNFGDPGKSGVQWTGAYIKQGVNYFGSGQQSRDGQDFNQENSPRCNGKSINGQTDQSRNCGNSPTATVPSGLQHGYPLNQSASDQSRKESQENEKSVNGHTDHAQHGYVNPLSAPGGPQNGNSTNRDWTIQSEERGHRNDELVNGQTHNSQYGYGNSLTARLPGGPQYGYPPYGYRPIGNLPNGNGHSVQVWRNGEYQGTLSGQANYPLNGYGHPSPISLPGGPQNGYGSPPFRSAPKNSYENPPFPGGPQIGYSSNQNAPEQFERKGHENGTKVNGQADNLQHENDHPTPNIIQENKETLSGQVNYPQNGYGNPPPSALPDEPQNGYENLPSPPLPGGPQYGYPSYGYRPIGNLPNGNGYTVQEWIDQEYRETLSGQANYLQNVYGNALPVPLPGTPHGYLLLEYPYGQYTYGFPSYVIPAYGNPPYGYSSYVYPPTERSTCGTKDSSVDVGKAVKAPTPTLPGPTDENTESSRHKSSPSNSDTNAASVNSKTSLKPVPLPADKNSNI